MSYQLFPLVSFTHKAVKRRALKNPIQIQCSLQTLKIVPVQVHPTCSWWYIFPGSHRQIERQLVSVDNIVIGGLQTLTITPPPTNLQLIREVKIGDNCSCRWGRFLWGDWALKSSQSWSTWPLERFCECSWIHCRNADSQRNCVCFASI